MFPLMFCAIILFLFAPGMDAVAATNQNELTLKNVEQTSKQKTDELWLLFNSVYATLQNRMKITNRSISTILAGDCEAEWDNNFQIKALFTDADNVDANNGLSLRGGYSTRGIEEDLSNYGDAYIELSWDVLKDGFKDNNLRADRIRRQAEIITLEGERKKSATEYRCRRFNIGRQFVALESSLISLKLQLMEPVYQAEKKAYFSGWSSFDEFLVSEEDIRLARNELEHIYSNPLWRDAFAEKVNPPVIDIDILAIIEAIKKDNRTQQIKELEKQNIIDKYAFEDGNRLRFFLRHEHRSQRQAEDDLVAGLRFTIPLFYKSTDTQYYKARQIDKEASYATWKRIDNTRTAYEQLRVQLERVVKQQYSYLRSKERVRRIQVGKSLNQNLKLAVAIARLRTHLDAAIELIQAKRELYRRVNEVFLVSGISFDEHFIKVSPLKVADYRARLGDRSIYIWSRRFNAMPNNQIIDFLEAKSIRRVLISAGKKTDHVKLNQFIEIAQKESIVVEAIIGSNNWLFPENHARAVAATAVAMERFPAVHFDIEPQAMKVSKQLKRQYVDYYLDLLREVRKSSPDGYLTIAVPFHWPDNVYQQLNYLSNQLYVMAYGTDKVETIVRRINRIAENVPLEKLTVVLRIDDFKSEWALEQAIIAIQKATGVNAFSFHQLDTFIKLSNN